MAKLGIAADLFKDIHKLQNAQRARISELISIFSASTAAELRRHKGVNLEAYHNAQDPRARTIRIDRNFRGIVMDLGDKESFILVSVLSHDDAEYWMANKTFKVNAATGALELVDLTALEAEIESLDTTPAPEATQLFAHRKTKDFTQLGVEADLIPALYAFTDVDQLLAVVFGAKLPQNQTDALLMLVEHESVEDIYRQLAGSINPEDVDVDDLAAAMEAPASKDRYRVFANEDEKELTRMLGEPLASWRVYLHHTQERLAYKDEYNGPARVTGGAGTGKTIVAIHRARFLASQLEDRSHKSILFTTFTRNLAEAIERQLVSLGGSELLDVVEVANVDRIAWRVVKEAEGASPRVVSHDDEVALWKRTVDELALDYSPEFLRHEWEQVILAQDIDSRSDYFQARRTGRGIRLDRRGRAQVWKGIEAFLQTLDSRGERTYLQLANAAGGYLRARQIKPYSHVVVDEAQDLHEAQWRLLRAAAPEAKNDMFIVGDSHQRIYDRRTSLSKVGINIRGRSHRLRINYRTTQEILRWAMVLLGEGTYDDLDGKDETQSVSTYFSHLRGERPTMQGSKSKKGQFKELTEQVTSWIDDGLDPEDIGIACRTKGPLDGAAAALSAAGVGYTVLGQELSKGNGVRLGTMHRMKGLEFLAMAVFDVNDDVVPLTFAMTDKSADEVQYRTDLERERCLLYVACTRARNHLWVGWSGKPSRFVQPMLNE